MTLKRETPPGFDLERPALSELDIDGLHGHRGSRQPGPDQGVPRRAVAHSGHLSRPQPVRRLHHRAGLHAGRPGAVFEDSASDSAAARHSRPAAAAQRLPQRQPGAICIYPGEKAQNLHFDDGFYQFMRPPAGVQRISTTGAIDAFMPEHGGTSHAPWQAAGGRPSGAQRLQPSIQARRAQLRTLAWSTA